MDLRFRFRGAASACGVALALAAGACGGEMFTAAAATDGGGGNDAGALDASSEAGTLGFCEGLPQKPFFCDDWDKGDIKSGWDTQGESRYGNEKLDVVSFRSAPKSFNASTTHSVLVPEETIAILQKDIGHLKQVTMELDLSVDAFGADPARLDVDMCLMTIIGFADMSFALGATAPSQVVFIESVSSDAGGTIAQHPIGANLPQGAWVHVKIELATTTSSTPGHVKVSFDGKVVLDTNLASPPPPSVSASLTMGIYLKHAPNLWNIHYDNLVVDKQ